MSMSDDNDNDIQDIGPESCVHEEAVMWNPYNQVVQCHRCGEVFVPGRAATPADAVFAFGAWLTSRSARVGPFSRYDDAAPMAELVGQFCDFQGWKIGPNYPHTFKMPPDGGFYPEGTYANANATSTPVVDVTQIPDDDAVGRLP